jgi:hypothetical protein
MNREWVTLAFGVLLVTGVVVVSVWQNYPAAPDSASTAPAAAPGPGAAPGSPTGEAAPDASQSEPAPTPAPPAPAASRLDTRVSVVHKHRFGDCEGTLRAAAGALTYSTSHKEDGFQLPFDEIDTFDLAPDKKNLRIRRRGGRTWNFTTRGEAGLALAAFHKEASARRR